MTSGALNTPLRILVACAECARQYDVGGVPVGHHFHCACGASLTVPDAQPHDADVVRCSSCGGPRTQNASRCGFCDSDYTLHERDLHTICPRCMTRISDRARFCHHCAQPILAQDAVGDATAHPCPVCGAEYLLLSRPLGEERLAVLECSRCAGLWLGERVFELLEERARKVERGSPVPQPPAATPERQEGPMYRSCPLCAKLMHRRNYGRRSGVIVDECAAHGLWFDAGELDRILLWIRSGGLTQALEHRAEERREEARRHDHSTSSLPMPMLRPTPLPGRDFVSWLIRSLRGD